MHNLIVYLNKKMGIILLSRKLLGSFIKKFLFIDEIN